MLVSSRDTCESCGNYLYACTCRVWPEDIDSPLIQDEPEINDE